MSKGLSNPIPSPDISFYRFVGTSPLEVWYLPGQAQSAALSTVSAAAGTISTHPFLSGKGGRVDRLAIEVTTAAGAGGVIRFGIYTTDGTQNLYPRTLVVDSGEFSTTTTGIKSATIDIVLEQNKVYHLVINAGTSAPSVRAFVAANQQNLFGSPADGGGTPAILMRLSGSRTYAALSATFPAGFSTVGTTGFAGAIRYAS